MRRQFPVPANRLGITLLFVLLFTLTVLRHAFPQSAPDGGSSAVRLGYQVTQSEYRPEEENRLLELLNLSRRQHNLPLLVMDTALRAAARTHSRNMATHGYIGHGSPEGESFLDRMAHVVRAGSFVGENVTIARTMEQAHSAFVESQDHRKNMLEPRFHRVGIGIATVGPLGIIVTQDFSE